MPEGLYADETPYVEAIRKLSGNIDITYLRNDEYDDFADLERMFIALEGPVRNVTQRTSAGCWRFRGSLGRKVAGCCSAVSLEILR